MLATATPTPHPEAAAELKVIITAETTALHRTESLLLHECVKNVSRHHLYLLGELWYGIRLWPYHANGKPVSLIFIPEYHPPPPQRDDFVRLAPDHSLCLDQRKSLQDWALDTPGKYTITAEYINPVSPAWVHEYLGIDIWSGVPGASAQLEIEVLP